MGQEEHQYRRRLHAPCLSCLDCCAVVMKGEERRRHVRCPDVDLVVVAAGRKLPVIVGPLEATDLALVVLEPKRKKEKKRGRGGLAAGTGTGARGCWGRPSTPPGSHFAKKWSGALTSLWRMVLSLDPEDKTWLLHARLLTRSLHGRQQERGSQAGSRRGGSQAAAGGGMGGWEACPAPYKRHLPLPSLLSLPSTCLCPSMVLTFCPFATSQICTSPPFVPTAR